MADESKVASVDKLRHRGCMGRNADRERIGQWFVLQKSDLRYRKCLSPALELFGYLRILMWPGHWSDRAKTSQDRPFIVTVRELHWPWCLIGTEGLTEVRAKPRQSS